MRLDPFFDIRNALRTDDPALAEDAPAYIKRLLDVITAIEAECKVSEDHAGGWGDSAAVYTENIRDIIRHYGNPS
jgi:hypothetical protein